MKVQSTTICLWFVIAGLIAAIPVYGYDSDDDYTNGPKAYARPYEQLVTHEHEGKGTFRQRFWVNKKYYKGKDAPIFLVLAEDDPGPMLRKMDENTIIRGLAEKHGGAMVCLQLRYHGNSYPYRTESGEDITLSERNLRYLTTSQIVADIVRFATTPISGKTRSDLPPATDAPWVLIGGGFPGGLVSWVLHEHSDIFAAGYSSSGTVQAKRIFSDFYHSIRQHMPKECARHVRTVVEYFDEEAVQEPRISKLKRDMGLSQIEHIDDIAEIMASELSHWKDVDLMTRPNEETRIHEFCAALKVRGDGLGNLLKAWKDWNKKKYGDVTDDEWSTHKPNASRFGTGLEMKTTRSRRWLQCKEYGWFHVAPPPTVKTVVSQQLTVQRETRLCAYSFPHAFAKFVELARDPGPSITKTNAKYGGWDDPPTNVFFVAGDLDPLFSLTMKSSGKQIPPSNFGKRSFLIRNGYHMSDLAKMDSHDDDVLAALSELHEKAYAFIEAALTEWIRENKR